MISTYSSFLFGFTITSENNALDLKEGAAAPLACYVAVGQYTATTICQAIADALNAQGLLTYTVTFNRTTRAFTITTSSSFQLLGLTGTNTGSSIHLSIGLTATDLSSTANAITGAASGTLYAPQYWLQDYVSTDDWQQAVDATVNKTASGRVEVYRVGTEKFSEFNLKWITDRTTTGSAITNNASGVANARSFMQFAVTKAPFEFMPDKNAPATFQTFILETTPTSSSGTGYKLDEQYERNLPGFFETGRLKLRLIE